MEEGASTELATELLPGTDAEEGALCFKCGGSGQTHFKKAATRRQSRREEAAAPGDDKKEEEGAGDKGSSITSKHEPGMKACGVCGGKGLIIAMKKVKAMATAKEVGIITPCYRAPGAEVVPGPRPRPLGSVMPLPGEALCCLTGDWRIFQPLGGHRYSTDDVVTAWYAARQVTDHMARRRSASSAGAPSSGGGAGGGGGGGGDADYSYRGLDLGTGLGSVMLMMAWRFPSSVYVGVEAQEASVQRARRSAYANHCEDRVKVAHGDLREIENVLPEGKAAFDVITGTPPYFDAYGQEGEVPPVAGSSAPPTDTAGGSADATVKKRRSGALRRLPTPVPAAKDQRPCNFFYRGGVDAYCRAAKYCLSPHPHATFTMCYTEHHHLNTNTTQEGDKTTTRGGLGSDSLVMAAARRAGLKVLSKLEVVPREGRPPLFAVWTMTHDCSSNSQGGGDGDGAMIPSSSTSSSGGSGSGIRGDGEGREAAVEEDQGGSESSSDSSSSGGGGGGGAVVVERLTVRHRDGTRSSEYIALMADMGMPQRPTKADDEADKGGRG